MPSKPQSPGRPIQAGSSRRPTTRSPAQPLSTFHFSPSHSPTRADLSRPSSFVTPTFDRNRVKKPLSTLFELKPNPFAADSASPISQPPSSPAGSISQSDFEEVHLADACLHQPVQTTPRRLLDDFLATGPSPPKSSPSAISDGLLPACSRLRTPMAINSGSGALSSTLFSQHAPDVSASRIDRSVDPALLHPIPGSSIIMKNVTRATPAHWTIYYDPDDSLSSMTGNRPVRAQPNEIEKEIEEKQENQENVEPTKTFIFDPNLIDHQIPTHTTRPCRGTSKCGTSLSASLELEFNAQPDEAEETVGGKRKTRRLS